MYLFSSFRFRVHNHPNTQARCENIMRRLPHQLEAWFRFSGVNDELNLLGTQVVALDVQVHQGRQRHKLEDGVHVRDVVLGQVQLLQSPHARKHPTHPMRLTKPGIAATEAPEALTQTHLETWATGRKAAHVQQVVVPEVQVSASAKQRT